MEKKGLIHIYTGDGKGKTTASIGLAVRAIGAGMRVKMVQFMKALPSAELEALKKFEPCFQMYRFQSSKKFFWNMNKSEITLLRSEIEDTFSFVRDIFRNSSCDMLILDEIMSVLEDELVEIDEILSLLKEKPILMEVVLTGRNAPDKLVDVSDYVSDVRCVKHPYQKGIGSRPGVDY